MPDSLLKEEVFSYDSSVYNMRMAVVSLLKQCDADIVGSFRGDGESKLEDLSFKPIQTPQQDFLTSL